MGYTSISSSVQTTRTILVQTTFEATATNKFNYLTEFHIQEIGGSYSDTIDSSVYELSGGQSHTVTILFEDLPSGTQFNIYGVAWYNDGVNGWQVGSSSTNTITVATLQTVDKWSWTSSNGSASSTQTISAYNAITQKGKTKEFSYLVWNDMCDKVMEILTAIGRSWNTSEYGLSLSQTKMSSGDKQLTAQRFNSLRYNIGHIYSTGILEVSAGDYVYGSYFSTLCDCMNGWIDRDII